MKKIFFVIAAISLAFISCVKENTVVTDETEGVKDFYIRGIGEDTQTKTTYTDNGTSYQFSWVANDKIAVQTVKIADGSFDSSGFVAQSINGATADFHAQVSGDYELGGYAFYPLSSSTPYNFQYGEKLIYYGADQTDLSFLKSGTAYSTQQAASATVPTVRLFGTITENSEYPMRHIPMIGKNDGNGNFHFKAATGVLKVSFSGLPTTATQIRLDAVDYALNGYFVFDTDCEIKESYSTQGWGQKYMNFTPSSSTSRDFYFPIPTGTIPAGKLTVSVTDGSNTLYSVTNKVDITLNRGEITELPTITVPWVKVTISGTPSAPTATFDYGGKVKSVRYYVDGGHVEVLSSDPEVASGETISLTSSSTGKYYLNYVAYDKDGNAIIGSNQNPYYVNYYVLTSSDASTIAGTYKFQSLYSLAAFNRSKWVDLTETTDNRMVIAVSDNPEKGSLMITDLYGFRSDGVVTNESLTNANNQNLFTPNNTGGVVTAYMQTGSFSSGKPVYGWLDSSTGTVSFENTTANNFFKYGDAGYVLRNGNQSTSFSLTYSSSSTPVTVTCNARICIVPSSHTGAIDGSKTLLWTAKDTSGALDIVGKKQ